MAKMGRSTVERAILSLLVLTAFLIGVSTATATIPSNNSTAHEYIKGSALPDTI